MNYLNIFLVTKVKNCNFSRSKYPLLRVCKAMELEHVKQWTVCVHISAWRESILLVTNRLSLHVILFKIK